MVIATTITSPRGKVSARMRGKQALSTDHSMMLELLNNFHCGCQLHEGGCFERLKEESLDLLQAEHTRRYFNENGSSKSRDESVRGVGSLGWEEDDDDDDDDVMMMLYLNYIGLMLHLRRSMIEMVGSLKLMLNSLDHEHAGGLTHEMRYVVATVRVCGRAFAAVTLTPQSTLRRYVRRAAMELSKLPKPQLILTQHETEVREIMTSPKAALAFFWLTRRCYELGQEQPGRAPRRVDGKLLRHIDPPTLACKVCTGDSAKLCVNSDDCETPVCWFGLFAYDMLQDRGLTDTQIPKKSTFTKMAPLAMYETNTRCRRNQGAASDCLDCNTKSREDALARGDSDKIKRINKEHRRHTKCWMRLRQEEGHFGLLSLETKIRKDTAGWLSGMLDGAGSDWAHLPLIHGPRGKGSNNREHRLHFKPMVHYARGFGVSIIFAPPFLKSGVDLNLTCITLTLHSIIQTYGFLPSHLRETFDGGDKRMTVSKHRALYRAL